MSGMVFAAYCGQMWRLTIHFSLVTFTCCSRQHHHPTKSEFLADLLLDYNHQIPPMFERGNVCDVTVSVFINSVNSITEADMEFTTDLIVEQRWTDERLDFREKVSSPFLELDSRLTDRIWIPDLYFVNEKQSAFREVSTPNKMLHLYRNGSVVYKARYEHHDLDYNHHHY
ncbi:hypothetical protein V1264_003809 [Littorina saxatilis]|uniref:Neurotransmitter-gated ion-channel ligand-binding domain-containing protein n=1 Tax=Littorina saxatilis TaxID=31220 RepID=A0AAN9B0P2_9CAEN